MLSIKNAVAHAHTKGRQPAVSMQLQCLCSQLSSTAYRSLALINGLLWLVLIRSTQSWPTYPECAELIVWRQVEKEMPKVLKRGNGGNDDFPPKRKEAPKETESLITELLIEQLCSLMQHSLHGYLASVKCCKLEHTYVHDKERVFGLFHSWKK